MKKLTWFAREIPLRAAASKLDPSSQSPQIPALPRGSKMQGIPGLFVGRAAPLCISRKKKVKIRLKNSYQKPLCCIDWKRNGKTLYGIYAH